MLDGNKNYVATMLITRYLSGSAVALVLGVAPVAAEAAVFTATLEGDQVVSPNFPTGVPSAASGLATFELNEDGTALSYEIQLSGVTLKADSGDRTDGNDVTKIHIHRGESGTNGPHVLNIFGLPSEDDDDLVVDFSSGILTGVWTDADAFDDAGLLFNPDAPNTTKTLSSALEDLQSGDLYIQVHTNNFDGLELRGQIESVPEPAMALGLAAVAGLGLYTRRKSEKA